MVADEARSGLLARDTFFFILFWAECDAFVGERCGVFTTAWDGFSAGVQCQFFAVVRRARVFLRSVWRGRVCDGVICEARWVWCRGSKLHGRRRV